MSEIDKQRELISKVTSAANIVNNAGTHGSGDFMIASSYVFDIMFGKKNIRRKKKDR